MSLKAFGLDIWNEVEKKRMHKSLFLALDKNNADTSRRRRGGGVRSGNDLGWILPTLLRKV